VNLRAGRRRLVLSIHHGKDVARITTRGVLEHHPGAVQMPGSGLNRSWGDMGLGPAEGLSYTVRAI
jgi:hypothetical protein